MISRVLIGGHRGLGTTDSDFAQQRNTESKVVVPAENTLESLLGALRAGADFIETDAIATSDGEIVLIHSNDPSTHIFRHEYKIPGKTYIDEMTVHEVTSLRTGLHGGGRIPSLRQLLRGIKKEFPGNGTVLNLELKGIQATPRSTKNAPPLVKAVLETIVQEGFPLERILFSSFSLTTMEKLAALEPKAKLGMLFYTAPLASSYGDTVLYDDGSETYVPFTKQSMEGVLKRLPALKAVLPDIHDLTGETVGYAGQRNLSIVTYGYLEESPFRSQKFADATSNALRLCRQYNLSLGLITDYIADVKRFIRQNPSPTSGGERSVPS